MEKTDPKIWVVDDEPDVLDAIALLLSSADFAVETFPNGSGLLSRIGPEELGCILLDLRMPEMNGLQVQRELQRRRLPQPVVFLSGHGDIPIAVRAIQAGAIDFLEKPVREKQLLAAVGRALEIDHLRRQEKGARIEAESLLASLTPRESQVADLLLAGLRTTQIAERLDLSKRTVEMHRARLLKRLGARTTAEAVRIVKGAHDLVAQP